jgi:hypothetical protein
MDIKNLLIKKEKKAWIRIVEAFTAILILMSALLVIVSRQKSSYNSDDEIIRIQSALLDYISQDENLRGQILSGNTLGVYAFLSTTVPPVLNYSAYVCLYDQVCPNLALAADSNVAMYSQSRPIVANLTYSPAESLKIQIYFWRK